MASMIAFVVFDLLGIAFLLWCLVNFVREDRRNRGTVSIVRIDPVSAHSSNLVSMGQHATSRHKQQHRIEALRNALAIPRSHRG